MQTCSGKGFYILVQVFLLPWFSKILIAQQPSISLSKTLGGAGYEAIKDIIVDQHENIIALCMSDSNDQDVNCTVHGKSDVWVVKMDEGGNILSQFCYGGSNIENPYQIIQTNDGGFL